MDQLSRVRVGDGALACREVGTGDPVLLLHSGFIADSMLPLMSEPSVRDHRLITYHRRGYGDSDPVGEPRGMAEAAGDAFGLLDALGVERAHLVGHSMGAALAIEMALTESSRVRSVTLMEPLLGFALSSDAAAFVADTAQVALPRFAAGDNEGALDGWLTGAFGPGFKAILDQRLPGAWAQAVRDAGCAFGIELPALQAWPRGTADLERIEAPALSVVHPDQNWAGFAETHAVLLSRVRDCRAATVDVASHLLQIANPAVVAEAIAAFLGETGRRDR
jgi:pimeloyl-ACP methyl ester carboxylesterase